ncbi:MAG TPA: nuclear transport factor 2 family protein [Solirubrobacteraceae bacterium]|nr:nuclear transport factor 2 family protein [Solirubrobacteraceae bacterium]
MSENLGLVRSIYAAWECGDYSSAEWAAPDIENVFADGPEPGSVSGLPGARAQFSRFLASFEGYRSQAQEYRELDDERILVFNTSTARGKSSGVEVITERASVFHLRDAKVTRIVTYWDRDRALTDLGLTE